MDASNVRVIVDGVVLEGRCSIDRMEGPLVAYVFESVYERVTPYYTEHFGAFMSVLLSKGSTDRHKRTSSKGERVRTRGGGNGDGYDLEHRQVS